MMIMKAVHLREIVPLADSTIYEMEQPGEFPSDPQQEPLAVTVH
jgi:predicted DNA-binding transcriptional regulator AlpA